MEYVFLFIFFSCYIGPDHELGYPKQAPHSEISVGLELIAELK